MKYELVIFDLGSTLIKYDNQSWDELGLMGCENAVPLLKEETGIEVSPEKLWQAFSTVIGRMFKAQELKEIDLHEITSGILTDFGIVVTDGLPGRFIKAYYQPVARQVSLIPGAPDILSKIKEEGMKIGLLSNTIFPANYHRDEMKKFGIFGYFDYTLFSSEEKIRKPNEKFYRKALSLTRTKPENAIFIGDRLVEDIGGPQSVGIKGVLKYTEGRDYSADITPYKIINELGELENILLT